METSEGAATQEPIQERPTIEGMARYGLKTLEGHLGGPKILRALRERNLRQATAALDNGDLGPASRIIKQEADRLFHSYQTGSAYGEAMGHAAPMQGTDLDSRTEFFQTLTSDLDKRLSGQTVEDVDLTRMAEIREQLSH